MNFQTKNAIIPTNAIPPATDNPMIDPVPSPELPLAPWSSGGGVGVGLEPGPVMVTTTTDGEPSAPVVSIVETCWFGVGVEGGVVGEDGLEVGVVGGVVGLVAGESCGEVGSEGLLSGDVVGDVAGVVGVVVGEVFGDCVTGEVS